MKRMILSLFFISHLAFAVTGNKVWRVPNGGTLPSWGPVNLADGTNAVTGLLSKANTPAVGQVVSSSSGSASTTSGSFVDATNLSVTLTTTGRPVWVIVIPDSTGTLGAESYIGCTVNSGNQCAGAYAINRDGSDLAISRVDFINGTTGANYYTLVPPGSLNYVDVGASAGSHTYKIRYAVSAGNTAWAVKLQLMAFEM